MDTIQTKFLHLNIIFTLYMIFQFSFMNFLHASKQIIDSNINEGSSLKLRANLDDVKDKPDTQKKELIIDMLNTKNNRE